MFITITVYIYLRLIWLWFYLNHLKVFYTSFCSIYNTYLEVKTFWTVEDDTLLSNSLKNNKGDSTDDTKICLVNRQYIIFGWTLMKIYQAKLVIRTHLCQVFDRFCLPGSSRSGWGATEIQMEGASQRQIAAVSQGCDDQSGWTTQVLVTIHEAGVGL